MNATEIRELETEELHGRISELKEELFNLRFQLATGQLDNHSRMQQARREIARIKTILRERDFAVAEGAKSVPAAPKADQAPAAEPETTDGES